jgi:hypothetical protein
MLLLGWIVMLTALWNHSILISLAGIVFWTAACLKLPEAKPPFKFVEMCLKWERGWIAKKWDFKKISRFVLVLAAVAVFLFAIWKNSYISLLLFAGFGINMLCIRANKAMGVEKP